MHPSNRRRRTSMFPFLNGCNRPVLQKGLMVVVLLLLNLQNTNAQIVSPTSVDGSWQVSSVLAEPDLRTPTGIAVGHQGEIYVIECHTHFRPDNYDGPATDRILLVRDHAANQPSQDDAQTATVDRTTVFYEGSIATMGIAVEEDGGILVATRSEIFRLRDLDGDHVADERTTLARLETAGDYPHNGLSGFAIDPLGAICFGFGENLGADYTLIGTDGSRITGGGEGGNIFRMQSDGSKLERWATGFWNPFHLAIDDFGRLFAVDNDPDWRPPCRLLHVVRDGDYGYRFALGRRGTHPFTSWFGDRPDRLGMVAGTGEAPSGIVSYRGGNLAESDEGSLLVTSWGLHTIERYRLLRQGATFSSQAEIRVKGDEDFRPVGLAVAPDGSLIASDWVKRSYPLHGFGRIWQMAASSPTAIKESTEDWQTLNHSLHRMQVARAADVLIASEGQNLAQLKHWIADSQIAAWRRAIAMSRLFRAHQLDRETLTHAIREGGSVDLRVLAATFAGASGWSLNDLILTAADAENDPEVLAEWIRRTSGPNDTEHLKELLAHDDRWVRQAAVAALARHTANSLELWPSDIANQHSERVRIELACTLARRDDATARMLIPKLMEESSATVRWVTLRWIAETNQVEHREVVERELQRDRIDVGQFEAVLATLERLDGVSGAAFEGGQAELLASIVKAERSASPALIALALQRIDRIARRDRVEGAPKGLELETLRALLRHENNEVRIAAARVLGERYAGQDGDGILLQVALETTQPLEVRREALAGLSAPDAILSVAQTSNELSDDAVRGLRGLTLNDSLLNAIATLEIPASASDARLRLTEPGHRDDRPTSIATDEWMTWLAVEGVGNAERGERWFYAPRVARCGTCHAVNGRGGSIGPELTQIGEMGRVRLLESLLEPSREIAPRYTAWVVETIDGSIRSGLLETERGEQQFYVDSTGSTFVADHDEIVGLSASDRSLMPDDLLAPMTRDEIADLLAYLESLK